jgi:two-component system nitrogen regulation response regulator NtrX
MIDVRLIAATNKELKQEIGKGNFREDLYFRLNVVRIHLPALRERKGDIPLLTRHFLKEFATLHLKKAREISDEAIGLLEAYPWPGNIRELKNLIERLTILQSPEDEHSAITAEELKLHLNHGEPLAGESFSEAPKSAVALSSGMSLKDAKADFEREYIVQALKDHQWNITKTAQTLGIERSYLHRRMNAFGIEVDEE